MSDIRELYQQVILDHSKKPRNFHEIPDPDCHAEGYNPLCGDEYKIYITCENGVITDISFTGSGCAISRASASMMTSALKGKTFEEAQNLFDKFHQMVTSDITQPVDENDIGKLAVFSGVREFPLRIKCASLPWHAMNSALKGEKKPVTTE